MLCGMAEGRVENRSFYSTSAGMNRTLRIYLPPGYNAADTTVRYSTIYFLHGGGANHTYYEEIVAALDTLIGTEIHPVILVRPDGYSGPYWGMTWWSNSDLNGDFEDFVVYDAVEYMESHYNVYRDGGKRSLIGHSMGGYGAVKLALKHPDRFRAVAAHSGVTHLSHVVVSYYIPSMVEENGGSGPFNPTAGDYSQVLFSLARALSPNLNRPPYYVNLPCANDGSIIDSVFGQWQTEDPAKLVSQYNPAYGLGIYLDSPSGDGAFPVINSLFADSLDLYGIPHYLEIYNASGHWDPLPQRYPICLHFLDSLMWSSASLADRNPASVPQQIALSEVYPTPFNGRAMFRFELRNDAHVNLTLFNLQGRLVQVLANRRFGKGEYAFSIDGSDLASGVYYLRAITEKNVSVLRKAVLIR